MTRARAAAAAAAILLAAGAAAAQNPQLAPAFGSYRLSAGFTPDPFQVNVTAGGTVDAARLGQGCVGRIAEAPDVRIDYRAGSFPLAFKALSQSDVTIVVNDPNGRWHCNDDYPGMGTNAAVVFRNPPSGQYDVWIGTYDRGPGQASRLQVTEVP